MTSLTEDLSARCARDGEFALLSRFWTGVLRVDLGNEVGEVVLVDGVVGDPSPGARSGQDLTLSAPVDVWAKLLAPLPPPFFNDIIPARAFGLDIVGETETFWQYYPAVRRVVELLRAARSETGPTVVQP